MAEIDFLSDNNKRKKNNKEKAKDDSAEIKWTSPQNGGLSGNRAGRPAGATKEAGYGSGIHSGKMRSRASIPAGNGKDSAAAPAGDVKKLGFFGWLGKIIKKRNKTGMPSGVSGRNSNKTKLPVGRNGSLGAGAAQPSASKQRNAGRKPSDTGGQNDKWKAREIIKTNLIKGELTIRFEWAKHLKIFLFYALSSSLFIFILYGGLFLWEKKLSTRGRFLLDETRNTITKIKNIESDVEKADRFEKKLLMVKLFLNRHIYWTDFFDFLDNNTLDNVYYSRGFSGEADGKYSLTAHADSYHAITDQIKALKQQKEVLAVEVEKAKLIGGGAKIKKQTKEEQDKEGGQGAKNEVAAEEGVEFTLNLTLNPAIFFASSSSFFASSSPN